MPKLMIGRLVALVPLLLIVSFVTFLLVGVAGQDPAQRIVGEFGTAEQIAQVRDELGLNRPIATRYFDWLDDAVRGDFGKSVLTNQPVSQAISRALPVTVSLLVGALTVSLTLGLLAGVWSAIRSGQAADRVLMTLATAGVALPGFWLGTLLIFGFALKLSWFPAIGYTPITESFSGWFKGMVLPSVALGLIGAASIARQTRSSLVGVFQQEYVRTAFAKGLTVRRVVAVHSVKNAAAPVLTTLAYQVSSLLGGSVIIERLFVLPGIGTIAINAVLSGDQAMLLGIVMTSVVVVVAVNLLLDVAYGLINPKVRTT